MIEMAEEYYDEFEAVYGGEEVPAGLSPLELQTYYLETRKAQGRSPSEWLDYSQTAFSFETMPAKAARTDTLVQDVVRLNTMLGNKITSAQQADMARQAAAMDPALRDAFAQLVATVVDAYAAQMPLAAELTARFPTDYVAWENFVSPAQRDEMLARAEGVVAAVNAFRKVAEDLQVPAAACGTPNQAIFRDPEDLIVIGDTCDNTWAQTGGNFLDPVLLVDLGGADTYTNSAGGADPAGLLTQSANKLVLSVVADVAGSDDYTYNGAPDTVQGAGGIGGIGILMDASGDDYYYAKMTRTNQAILRPAGQYYFDGGAQGYGFGGIGVQLDASGSDTYDFHVASTQGNYIWAFGQGFGALGTVGISNDYGGNDWWLSYGDGITGGTLGFQGIYTMGMGIWAGVGIMNDLGRSNDIYKSYDNSTTTDYYAQGFGAFGGVGILFEDGGDDKYWAVSIATNSWINMLLHCAYGTGSLFGVGVMIDVAGNDYYYGKAQTGGTLDDAHVMDEGFGGIGEAIGVFADLGGTDTHIMEAVAPDLEILSGRGVFVPEVILDNIFLGEGGNVVGLYLEVGGVDTYVGPGHDNGVWAFGADINV